MGFQLAYTATAAVITAVFAVDQLTKEVFSVVHTTSRLSGVVMILAITIPVVLLVLQRRMFERFMIAVVLGGAMSNTLDIFLYGYVRDIFVISAVAYNVADVAVIGGVLGFLVRKASRISTSDSG